VRAVSARPASGLDRLVDTVSGVFGGRPSVAFRPVEGVLRPEPAGDGTARRAPARRAPVRLYDRRGQDHLVETPALGLRVDTYA
jgi:hypothetical protein